MSGKANGTMFATFATPSLEAISSTLWLKQHLLLQVCTAYMTWSVALKLILAILILVNLKVFPFIYHLRVLNAVRFVLKSQRPPQPITPAQLFQPLITSSRACLMEIDVLGHKSNSTYFLDVDIARAHLVTTLFSTAIEKFRGSTTMNGLSGKPKANFTLALGAVSCTFRKELRPYEQYDMWTRVLSWDQKWFYLVTHFVKKGARLEPEEFSLYPQQNESRSLDALAKKGLSEQPGTYDRTKSTPICATALSKVVFKDSRLTISPEAILEAAGLLPMQAPLPDSEEQPADKVQLTANGRLTRRLPTGHGAAQSSASITWARQEIEAERLRGMAAAKLLGEQTILEDELHHRVALGRHYDGFGIEGVVATLAQLGKFSNYQLL